MRNITKNKIKSAIISKPFVRNIRGVFYNKVFPYLKYSFYFLFVISIVILTYLAIFKKSQLGNFKDGIVQYGYRIINFSNGDIYKKINVVGNKYTSYEDVIEITKQYTIDNKNFNNKEVINAIKNQIQALPWIEEVIIGISLQDSLNINIKEHQPFAIWEDQDKKYIVSKDGEIIAASNIEKFNNLLILTGKNAYKNVKSLFNILAIDPSISQNVYSATWVGGRRWDIRFENGLLVKLPKNNSGDDMSDAWNSLIEVYSMPGSLIGLKTIDLRIAKKIYLEYDEGQTKEIKSL